MATIKSFSDLQQSRKLAEILPLESADMYWWSSGKRYYIEAMDDGDFNEEEGHVRAWSLAALLNVLPKGEYKDVDLCFGGYQGDEYISEWFCSYEQQEPFIIEVCHADNPVDACYEMILKLYELKML